MWLDPELVRSRSSDCMRLVAEARRDLSTDVVAELSRAYTGRFALDFMYEDWAVPFRDTLHASYLDRIERAVKLDMKLGAYDRAIAIAHRGLMVDPEADEIELCLLRLYKLTGAHSAAAEQYAHYAAMMREQLGVEPPPLESM
jgi:DNA-binding SARP family transcriptional activator